MATTVRIEGDQITLNDAASEETLRELVDLLSRQQGSSGNNSSMKTQQKQTADNMKKAADNLKNASVKLEDVVETFDDVERNATKTFSDIGNKIGKELGQIAKNTGNVISDLVRGPASFETIGRALQSGSQQAGELMEEFAQGAGGAIPGIGALGTVAKTGAAAFGAAAMAAAAYAQNLTDGFVALSQSGANYNTDVARTQAEIRGIGLTMNGFTQIVQQNAAGFAVFGGNVRQGTKMFVELADTVHKNFGGELAALGLRFEEQNESLARFISMQDRNVAFQNMSYMEQSELYRNYITDLDRLVKLTGKNRDQLQSEIAAIDLRADANLRLRGATQEAREALAFVFNKTSPDSAISQIISAGIAGKDLAFEAAMGNDTIKAMLAGAPGVAEDLRLLGEGIANGTISQQDLQNKLGQISIKMQGIGDANAELFSPSNPGSVPSVMTQTASDLQSLGTQVTETGGVNDKLGSFGDTVEKEATGLGGLATTIETSMKEAGNTIVSELTNSITNWADNQGLSEMKVGETIQNVINNLDLIAQEFRLFASAPLDYIMGGLEKGDLVDKIYDKHGGKRSLAESLNMRPGDLNTALRNLSDDDLKKLVFADADTGLTTMKQILGTSATQNLSSSATTDDTGQVDPYALPSSSLADLENYLNRVHPNPYASGLDAPQYAQAIQKELVTLRATKGEKALEAYYAKLRAMVQGAVGHEALAEMDPMSDPNLYIKSTFKSAFNGVTRFNDLPQLQYGGPAGMGNPYIVGERGPELFIPNTAGTVTPTGELATAQGNMSILAKLDQLNSTMSLVAGNTGSKAQVDALNNQISTLRQLLSEAKRTYRVSRDLRDNTV